MTPTPDNFRPPGASDHWGWDVIGAAILAVSNRTANASPENVAAEMGAVRLVNVLLASEVRAVPPSRDAAEGAGPNARLMPLLDLPPAEQFDIATKLAENVGYALSPDAYADVPDVHSGTRDTSVPSPDGAIPLGVYFLAEMDNFYSVATQGGCGNEFYRKWKPRSTVVDEQHTARFLARLFYYRGVAYGKGLESADAWVDANWRFFLGDARRLGAIAPAVGVTREEMKKLLISAKLLQQNSEGCAANHYGNDCRDFGMPGWLADTKKDIEAAEAALSPVPDATVSAEDDAAFEERLLKQDARYMLRLVDYIADKIGLPNNEELSQANFIAWFSAPRDVGATVEAFARSLENRAAGYAARSDSIFNGSIIAEELTEQARRLRSLSGNGGGCG